MEPRGPVASAGEQVACQSSTTPTHWAQRWESRKPAPPAPWPTPEACELL